MNKAEDSKPPPSVDQPPSKRRKTTRACDTCRTRKLKCVFADGATECIACKKAGVKCESVKPAKIDKRRLVTLMERAKNHDDQMWIAEQVASRGVYTASTDHGSERKARKSAVGNAMTLLAQLPAVPSAAPMAGTERASVEVLGGTSDESSLSTPPTTASSSRASRSPSRCTPNSATPSEADMTAYTFSGTRPGENSRLASPSASVLILSTDHRLTPPQQPPGLTHSVSTSETGPSQATPSDVAISQHHWARNPLSPKRGTKRSRSPSLLVNDEDAIKDPLHAGCDYGHTILSSNVNGYGLFRVDEYHHLVDEPGLDRALMLRNHELTVVDRLYGLFATEVAPIFPVMSPARLPAPDHLAPPLLYAILGVASQHREVPYDVYAAVCARFSEHVLPVLLGPSSICSVQTLLVSTLSPELHGQLDNEAASAAWNRAGLAGRQGLDLGIDAPPLRGDPEAYADQVRAWTSCVISDRLLGVVFDRSPAIDMSQYDDPFTNPILENEDESLAFQRELYQIAGCAGRASFISRALAAGRYVEDRDFLDFLPRFDYYVQGLSDRFAFYGQGTGAQGGLLNLLVAMTEIILYRPFVSGSVVIPAHITFRPKKTQWYATVQRARWAISWMKEHGAILLDCWVAPRYAVVYCALAQYYHCRSCGDADALRSLHDATHVLGRWSIPPGAKGRAAVPTFRNRTAEVVNALYRAASESMAGDLGGATCPGVTAKDRPRRISPTFRLGLTSSNDRMAANVCGQGPDAPSTLVANADEHECSDKDDHQQEALEGHDEETDIADELLRGLFAHPRNPMQSIVL